MNAKKILWAVIGIAVLGAGLAVSVYFVRQNQEIRTKAAPATNISISPSTQTKSGGEAVHFNVVMDTGTNQITAMDLVLSFDPKALEITSISKGAALGTSFSELKNSVDNTAGRIYYSVYSADKTKAVTGTNLTVLTIFGTVKSDAASGTYTLAFLAQTTAAGVNEGVNVLVAKSAGTLIVSVSTTPTLTPTPTPTATPKPTPTPTGTPGATPTSTPTPTLNPVTTAQPIPVSGTASPTMIVAGAGALLILIPLVFLLP
jgi:hypothetical protein